MPQDPEPLKLPQDPEPLKVTSNVYSLAEGEARKRTRERELPNTILLRPQTRSPQRRKPSASVLTQESDVKIFMILFCCFSVNCDWSDWSIVCGTFEKAALIASSVSFSLESVL